MQEIRESIALKDRSQQRQMNASAPVIPNNSSVIRLAPTQLPSQENAAEPQMSSQEDAVASQMYASAPVILKDSSVVSPPPTQPPSQVDAEPQICASSPVIPNISTVVSPPPTQHPQGDEVSDKKSGPISWRAPPPPAQNSSRGDAAASHMYAPAPVIPNHSTVVRLPPTQHPWQENAAASQLYVSAPVIPNNSLMVSQPPAQPPLQGDAAGSKTYASAHVMPKNSTVVSPHLVKSSSLDAAAPSAYIQYGSDGLRKWMKWTVDSCVQDSGEMSLRNVFPQFPHQEYMNLQMNAALAHTVHLNKITSNPAAAARGSDLQGLVFTIPPPIECNSKRVSGVIADRCKGLSVMMDDIEDEIWVIGCRDLELVVGLQPPKSGISFVDCHNCKLIVSNKAWKNMAADDDALASIKSSASSEIYVILIDEPPERGMAGLSSGELIQGRKSRQNIERVLLPDCYITLLENGILATHCDFSMDDQQQAAVALSPPCQTMPSSQTLLPSQMMSASIPPLPPRHNSPSVLPLVNSPSVPPLALVMSLPMPAQLVSDATVGTRSHELAGIQGTPPFLVSTSLCFKLKLGLEESAAGRKFSRERSTFEDMLCQDLAHASGLPTRSFQVQSIFGYLIADIRVSLLLTNEGKDFFVDGTKLASSLEQQYSDPSSRLRTGSVTQYAQGLAFPFDVGLGIVAFKHKLRLPYDVAGSAGSVERLSFQNKYMFDLCSATGLHASRFRIKHVSAGSLITIVEIEIHPDPTDATSFPRIVLADFERQARDPKSKLLFGELTRFTEPEIPSVDSLLVPLVPVPPELPPAILIGTLNQSVQSPQLEAFEPRSGIGVAVGQHPSLQDGFFVADIMPNSPAFIGGIQKGDYLECIDGQLLKDLKLTNVVRLLRGPAGTQTRISIRRNLPAGDNFFAITLTRPFPVREALSSPVAQSSPISILSQERPSLSSMQNNEMSSTPKIGLGLGIAQDEDGLVRVDDILKDSVSERESTIQRNDIIEKIDGMPVRGMHLNDVVARLRGPEYSTVELDMRRNNWNPLDPNLDLQYLVALNRVRTPQVDSSDILVSLNLGMNMWEIGDYAAFQQEVASDVAHALGSSITRVRVVGLRAGSVIVDVLLTPKGGRTGMQLVHDLSQQARDLSSPLMRGKHTCRTRTVSRQMVTPQKTSVQPDVRKTSMWSAPMTGTLGPSLGFLDNKIVRDSQMEIRHNFPSSRAAPVPLVPQPESVLWAGEGRQIPRTGIGLGLTSGKGLVYTVCGLTPGGAAEASGQLQRGDVVHSIDGMIVTGRAIAEIQDLVIGDAGTKVMVAVLRSDALPEDLQLDLSLFERWRPVVLVRSVARTQNADQTQKDTVVPQLIGKDVVHYSSEASARKSLWPLRDGREVIAVDLVLDEDFEIVAPTVADKAFFSAQLTHDISTALRVPSSQVSVVDLLPGSVIAVIQFLSAGNQEIVKDPEELAMELIRQASNKQSALRQCVSCRRARYARPRMSGNTHSVSRSHDPANLYASNGGVGGGGADQMTRLQEWKEAANGVA